jgi:anthranilate phosphoribosyltransferase
MNDRFRELLKKVGSGQHTKKDLTRAEAMLAADMMLTQEATPAQIGAFLIAHRMKRPTGTELAGMLDAYDRLGVKLKPLKNKTPIIFGIPYDGRTRTAPINLISLLILAAAEVPVISHGGKVMPTKYGVPLIEIWQGLGLDFRELSLAKLESLLEKTNFTFVYTPEHFPLVDSLVPYRDQIGKRPPLATLELIWSPYGGKAHLVIGYVHPPTEFTIKEAFGLREQTEYTLVKGLEGSCDLRLSQTTIVGVSDFPSDPPFKYLKLDPHDYDLAAKEIALESTPQLITQLTEVLEGKSSDMFKAAIWNGGFYLWRCGVCDDLRAGIDRAKDLLISGRVFEKKEEIKRELT